MKIKKFSFTLLALLALLTASLHAVIPPSSDGVPAFRINNYSSQNVHLYFEGVGNVFFIPKKYDNYTWISAGSGGFSNPSTKFYGTGNQSNDADGFIGGLSRNVRVSFRGDKISTHDPVYTISFSISSQAHGGGQQRVEQTIYDAYGNRRTLEISVYVPTNENAIWAGASYNILRMEIIEVDE